MYGSLSLTLTHKCLKDRGHVFIFGRLVVQEKCRQQLMQRGSKITIGIEKFEWG